MLCYEGKLSLFSFATPAVIPLIIEGSRFLTGAFFSWWIKISILLIFYLVLNVFIKLKYSNENYQIAVRAIFLGLVFCLGCTIFQACPEPYKPFGIYAVFMATFHYSEYLGIALSNPSTLTPDSFILNHSVHYHLAALASWLEFFIEVHYFPDMKTYKWVWAIGSVICLTGEILRKLAMITANKSFTHVVQFERHNDHKLVTHGVYSLMRHPSYVGWFWWSIGTQIILANPLCLVIYTFASWTFFRDRIFMEEITLLQFFGFEYVTYIRNVPTGLPFIRGYRLDK